MPQVTWTIQARCDLERIEDYIAGQGSPRTARAFIIALAGKAGRLATRPGSARIIGEDATGTYRQIVHGTYRIIVRRQDDQMVIVRIWHQRRILTTRHLKPT